MNQFHQYKYAQEINLIKFAQKTNFIQCNQNVHLLQLKIFIKLLSVQMHLNPQLKTQSRIKLISSDPNEIQKNSLNTSTSKMQYSIPKSKRWQDSKEKSKNSKFYDLPELRSNRSTSFGYGNKIDLSKRTLNTPSPLAYLISRQFDQNKGGISIGAGRDVVKNNSVFNERAQKIPGPSDYDINNKTMQAQPKYTIQSRHQDKSGKWLLSIPGPGSYSTLQLTKNNSKLQISSFQNSPSTSFSKNKRLSEYQQKLKCLKVPGPGHYQYSNQAINKYASQLGKKFSKSERKGIVEKSITPGPGAYKVFSDFIY